MLHRAVVLAILACGAALSAHDVARAVNAMIHDRAKEKALSPPADDAEFLRRAWLVNSDLKDDARKYDLNEVQKAIIAALATLPDPEERAAIKERRMNHLSNKPPTIAAAWVPHSSTEFFL